MLARLRHEKGINMSQVKSQVPVIDGWFSSNGGAPHLLGSQCSDCKSYFFPKESLFCRNPHCAGTQFDEVPLSRTGTIWSFTEHHYQPPDPYIAPDPFEPYTIAAVELAEEKMVILGQVAAGVAAKDLKAGMQVELVLEKIYEDEVNEYLVWKWKPLSN
jgi:uncharacterized OB-fold protein